MQAPFGIMRKPGEEGERNERADFLLAGDMSHMLRECFGNRQVGESEWVPVELDELTEQLMKRHDMEAVYEPADGLAFNLDATQYACDGFDHELLEVKGTANCAGNRQGARRHCLLGSDHHPKTTRMPAG